MIAPTRMRINLERNVYSCLLVESQRYYTAVPRAIPELHRAGGSGRARQWQLMKKNREMYRWEDLAIASCVTQWLGGLGA